MLNFPDSPLLNQLFGDWKWDGHRWVSAASAGGDAPQDGKTYGRSDGTWSEALPITGGNITGNLLVNGTPVLTTIPPVSGFLPLTGGTLTGTLTLPNTNATGNQAVRFTQLDTYLPKSGGTLTGALTLPNSNATGNQAVRFTQLATYMPLSREATVAELRAGTTDKVIGTTGLKTALNFVSAGNASGTFTPNFFNFINVWINLVGNTTLAFPTVDVTELYGRSGLMLFSNNVSCTLSFASGGSGYSFHRYETLDLSTDPGWYNLLSYTIWGGNRINLALLGAIY